MLVNKFVLVNVKSRFFISTFCFAPSVLHILLRSAYNGNWMVFYNISLLHCNVSTFFFCLNFRSQNLIKFYGIFFTLFYQEVLKKCVEKHDKFLKISSNYFLMFSFFFVDAFAKFVLLILHNVRNKHCFV